MILYRPSREELRCPGIYCIKANNTILYIGKSKNISRRIDYHKRDIRNKKVYKDKILNSLLEDNYTITFELVEKYKENNEDLRVAERAYICALKPPLNIEIPIEDIFGSKWVHQKHLKYDEILNLVN